jgi:hypothetical protein
MLVEIILIIAVQYFIGHHTFMPVVSALKMIEGAERPSTAMEESCLWKNTASVSRIMT